MRNSTNCSQISVAPMMDWTDRFCRYFHRLLAPHAELYTEMVTAAAVVHGDHASLLRFDASEHPVALQLGGSDPLLMAQAARCGADAGYDSININVGCPSDRVRSGNFGACLMAEPQTVAACFRAMTNAIGIPVTVKTRIGIDEHDSWEFFLSFIEPMIEAGCTQFIVHARLAILSGLSPKENRSIPPLNYERVYRLKDRYPELTIVLNGGICDVLAAREHLRHVDGVMIGREAYNNPWSLNVFEIAFADDPKPRSRLSVIHEMRPYIEAELASGTRLHRITRHMLGLFNGQPGARAWRRYLSENATAVAADFGVVEAALERMHTVAGEDSTRSAAPA